MDGFQNPEMLEVARKRRMAELLMQSPMPQGQMVSGHYVAPAFTQQLASVLNQFKGNKLSAEADQESKQLAQALQQKREAWMGEMPRESDNTSMAGPVIPQTPSAQDYMAWALKGQQIDPRAAQMGMQSANMQLNRDAQQQARADRAAEAERQRELQRELAQLRVQAGQQGRGDYFVPVQTSEGIRILNSRTGQLNMPQGQAGPLMPPSADPALQGRIAGAKAAATVEGKEGAEARMELPKVIAQGDETVKLIDDLLKHPGLKQAVGGSRIMGIQKIPGTPAYDFDTRLNQLLGKQFLAAFETLKGGGQITEVEGKKATQAIARMDAAQTEEEFINASKEFRDIVKAGVERAKAKAGGAEESKPTAPKRVKFDAQGVMIQ